MSGVETINGRTFRQAHDEAAGMVRRLYASQLQHATDLGSEAGRLGLGWGHCPFTEDEEPLRHRWRTAYIKATAAHSDTPTPPRAGAGREEGRDHG